MKNGRIPSIKAKLKTKNKKSMPFSFCHFHYFSLLPLSSLMLPISLSLTLSHSRTYNFSLAICLSLKLSFFSPFSYPPFTSHIDPFFLPSTIPVYPQSLSPQLLLSFFLPSILQTLLKCSFLPSLFTILSISSYSKQRNPCLVKKIRITFSTYRIPETSTNITPLPSHGFFLSFLFHSSFFFFK